MIASVYGKTKLFYVKNRRRATDAYEVCEITLADLKKCKTMTDTLQTGTTVATRKGSGPAERHMYTLANRDI